jgi:hypothetical protein
MYILLLLGFLEAFDYPYWQHEQPHHQQQKDTDTDLSLHATNITDSKTTKTQIKTTTFFIKTSRSFQLKQHILKTTHL